MSRLYTRILLSFWAVMISVVIGAVGLTWIVLLERNDDLGRAPGHLSGPATQALSDGGEAGLTQWLRGAVAEHREFHIYVVGPDGRDLLGRPLPPRAAFMAGRRAETEPPPPGMEPPPRDPVHEHDHGPPSPLAARLVPPRPVPALVSANGAEYLLIVIPHQNVLGPLEQPGARLGLLLVAVLVTGVASFWLTRSISRPVRALGDATRSLADGNLAARVAPRVSQRRDEFGHLARDFDAMAVRLQEQIDTKERLLQDISHELRSPLARMRVALGLARQQGGDVGVQLDRLEQEAERLNALIGQVLALSRVDQREVGTRHVELDLGDLVDGIARDAAFEAQARHVVVAWQPPAQAVTVAGDAALLASAVENVVRNALRYTPDGSTVSISLSRLQTGAGPRAQVTVTDQGPGVPDGELKRIFLPFHRVAASRGRDTGGDGLGLAITDRVMMAHSGSASAVNQPEGGLKITLELPCLA